MALPTSVIAQPFDQSWTLDDTIAYMALKDSRPKENAASNAALGLDMGRGLVPGPTEDDRKRARAEYEVWHREVYTPINDKLDRALAGHLLDLANQGQLELPPHTEGVKQRWLSAWQRLLNQEGADYPRTLLSAFRKGLIYELTGIGASPDRGNTDPVYRHDKLVAAVVAGNFNELDCDAIDCETSGENLYVRFNHWKPEMGTIARSGLADFEPLKPGQIKTPGIEHVTINAPSGHLLINDWFRIQEFSDACEKVDEEKFVSLESEFGMVHKTQRYADKLGFASVFVGDALPNIAYRDGRIDIGRFEDEMGHAIAGDGTNILGRVCTDLWWASIIDKQVLVDICARTLPREAALAKVEALIEETSGNLKQIQVPPGEYHLYFCGDYKCFGERFKSQEVQFVEGEQPMLTLSPKPLTLLPPNAVPGKPRKP